MLKADSSTLKSEREVQPTNTAPITPSVAALSWTDRTTLRIPSTELAGERLVQLGDQIARLVGPSPEPEQGEREEEQRHEREEREVGDHRGEVRPSIGEELAEDLSHSTGG